MPVEYRGTLTGVTLPRDHPVAPASLSSGNLPAVTLPNAHPATTAPSVVSYAVEQCRAAERAYTAEPSPATRLELDLQAANITAATQGPGQVTCQGMGCPQTCPHAARPADLIEGAGWGYGICGEGEGNYFGPVW